MTQPVQLPPLETLFTRSFGAGIALPPALAEVYGLLDFPLPGGRPYVIGNFVSTLDGVVTLAVPGHAGGGDISGFNLYDLLVMGLLRALADAVIIGAGALTPPTTHLWTPEFIYPPMADAYKALRAALGKTGQPLTVIVTSRGLLNLDLPVFALLRPRC